MKINCDNISKLDSYKLLTSSVVPRPIAWVTTLDADGNLNLAPFSVFAHVSKTPPKVMFAITKQKPGFGTEFKDTEVNILARKEFVINIPSVEHAEQVDVSADFFPPGVDEAKLLGLASVPSDRISVPRLENVGVSMECVLSDIADFSGDDRMMLLIGEVKMFHIRDDLYNDGKIDSVALNPLMRLGGPNYGAISQNIHIKERPVVSHRPYTGRYS